MSNPKHCPICGDRFRQGDRYGDRVAVQPDFFGTCSKECARTQAIVDAIKSLSPEEVTPR